MAFYSLKVDVIKLPTDMIIGATASNFCAVSDYILPTAINNLVATDNILLLSSNIYVMADNIGAVAPIKQAVVKVIRTVVTIILADATLK